MTFGAPWLLALALVVPVAALVWALGTVRGRTAARLISREGTVTRTGAAVVLLVAAAALAAFAASLPRWGERESFIPRTGAQVVFVVDVSRSMGATDVQPTRLEAVKQSIAATLGRLGGDRVGLVVYGGNALLRFPLTTDLEAAARVVRSLQPGSVFVEGGSSSASGLEIALRAFDLENDSGRLIVLFSDGEDLGADPVAIANEVRASGAELLVAGAGTPAGASVPVFDAREGRMVPLTGRDGQPVISRLDEGFLRALAVAAGGRYAGTNLAAVPGLIAAQVSSLQRATIDQQAATVPVERFAWFAGAAAILVTLACAAERLRMARRRAATAGLALAAGLVLAGCATEAHELNEQGLRAFAAGEYATAAERFIEAGMKSPGDATVTLNLAAALHAQGAYDQANMVARRVLQSRNPLTRARAYASLGHHRFAAGDLEGALDAFRRALIDNPGEDVSRRDYEVVLRLLGQAEGPEPPAEEPGGGNEEPGDPGQSPGGGEPGQEPGDGQPGGGAEPGVEPGEQPGGEPGPGEQPGTGTGSSPSPGSPRALEDAIQAIDAELRELYAEAGDSLSVAEALRILELVAERERLAGLRSTFAPVTNPDDR
jgi:Ca-activated chloride channel family protein